MYPLRARAPRGGPPRADRAHLHARTAVRGLRARRFSGWYACASHMIVAVDVETHLASCVPAWDRPANSSAPAYYLLQLNTKEDDEVCDVVKITAVGYASADQVGTGMIPMNWWVKSCPTKK